MCKLTLSLLVLLLGAVLEDTRELHIVEEAAHADGRLAVHLVHVLVGEAVAHGGEQLAKTLLVDDPVVLLVEASGGGGGG